MVSAGPCIRAVAYFRAVALFSCCLFSSLVAAATDSGAFRQALDAARNDDWNTLTRMEKQLGDDHPLQAYLDFHRLRAALPDLAPDRINDYARRYPDSPLPNDIRQLATVAYGKAKKWDALLAVISDAPSATARQCYYYQAKLANGDDTALQAAAQIWASGQSRPNQCDPLFDQAQARGVIDDAAIWERQLLAFKANSRGLIRYLAQKLEDTDYETASDWLETLYRDPDKVDNLPTAIKPERRQQLLAAALHRWAYKDTVAARQWFDEHSRRHGLRDETIRAEAGRRIAWYSTIRGIEENRQWLDTWLVANPDGELLDQRARRTIIEQDWSSAEQWISRLPENEQQDSRWLYWRARALEELDQSDRARALYQQAARQRNFFAFMAADRLGEPYHFSNARVASSDDFTPPPAITRVKLLRELGEDHAARQEWLWLMWHNDDAKVRQLAQHALEQQWYDLAVQASIQAKAWDVLAWRFPPAFQNDFERMAAAHDLDPWLAMAVARRESAFNPQARSPVGAMGLMQLMPATARKVAKDANLGRPTNQTLQNPDLNIQLGSRYLAELLDEFKGNRVLALAAYNAGPHRVNNWLGEEDDAVPADVWIESIPFRETRDYVQAVLTYRALFVGLHDNQARTSQLLTEKESQVLYSVSMLD